MAFDMAEKKEHGVYTRIYMEWEWEWEYPQAATKFCERNVMLPSQHTLLRAL